jgi:hypothetical protein
MTGRLLSINSGDRILASLTRSDLSLFERHRESEALKVRQRLETVNRKIKSVYFIDSGFGHRRCRKRAPRS